MAIELTTADSNTINSIRATLSAAEIFQNKILLPGDSGAQIAAENDYGVRIGDGNINTAPSTHIKVGGNRAFEIFGGPPGYSYKFDRKNTLTLPPSGTLSADGGAFNDGYLQWLGNASGDGNGYTTLELHPDSTRSESGQYLIIDPTAPNHIHIRAGGEQDNASAELILGGENSSFIVGAGFNPDVRITANNNQWTFTNYGSILFPAGGSLSISSSVPLSSTGTADDVPGTIVIDQNYLYYCFASYDGVNHIWKRVQFSASTW